MLMEKVIEGDRGEAREREDARRGPGVGERQENLVHS